MSAALNGVAARPATSPSLPARAERTSLSGFFSRTLPATSPSYGLSPACAAQTDHLANYRNGLKNSQILRPRIADKQRFLGRSLRLHLDLALRRADADNKA